MNRIKELREAAGLTQIQLANKLGLTHPSVFKWEHGRAMPTIDNLGKLADIFGVSVDEIIGRNRHESA